MTKMLEGDSLKKVMFGAYWKNRSKNSLEIHQTDMLEVKGPFEYDKTSISPEEYARLNALPRNERMGDGI